MKLAALLILSCLTCDAADRASWYGEKHRGLPMANGQRFNPDRLTAASWFFPLGTKVIVTHARRSVVVEITDRGPANRLLKERRKIDLSRAAFARLANPDLGLIPVTIKKANIRTGARQSSSSDMLGTNRLPPGTIRQPSKHRILPGLPTAARGQLPMTNPAQPQPAHQRNHLRGRVSVVYVLQPDVQSNRGTNTHGVSRQVAQGGLMPVGLALNEVRGHEIMDHLLLPGVYPVKQCPPISNSQGLELMGSGMG